jgi:ABC-type transport system involved in multi-copper enzyme maturation permease subunit
MNDDTTMKGSAVLWRETQKRLSCSRTFLFRLTYIIVGLFFLVYLAWAGDPYFAGLVSSIHLLVLAVVTIILAATAFVTDREKHTLDSLLCTPVRSGSLIAAKFLGVLKSVSVIALVPLLLPMTNLIPAVRDDGWGWELGSALLALTILTWLPSAIVVGLYFSAKLRRTGTAICSTFLVLLSWYLSPPLITFAARSQGVYTWWMNFILYLSPAGWVNHIFSEYAAWHLCVIAIPANIAWILLLVLFVRRFDEIIGRQ